MPFQTDAIRRMKVCRSMMFIIALLEKVGITEKDRSLTSKLL